MSEPPPRPSCLAEFEASPLPPADDAQDGERRFAVACRCGRGAFRVLGFPDDSEPRGPLDRVLRTFRRGLSELVEPAGLRGPIQLACEACGRQAVLFDPRLHGRGRRDRRAQDDVRRTGLEAIRCRLCRRSQLEVAIAVVYTPRWSGRPEDAPEKPEDEFDRFRLHARCAACENPFLVADLDC